MNTEAPTNNKTVHLNTIQFLKESAFRLKLDTIPVATACYIYHKFFKLCTTEEYCTYTVATAALFLAGKIEDQYVKARDVINVCHRVLHPNTPQLDVDNKYWTLRESIVECELFVIRVLGFHVTFKHPHKYMLHFLKSLNDWLPPGIVANVPICRTAWTFLADSYHTDLCVRHQADHIAVAFIYLSLHSHGVNIPCGTQANVKWWEALSEDITIDIIGDIVSDVADVYDMENKFY